MKQQKPFRRHASLLALALAASTAAWAQTTIPASFAHPRGSLNTATTGFTVRVAQATSAGGTLANSSVRAEAQLAGTLIDPLTGAPYANMADLSGFNPDGTYNEPSNINYDVTGGIGALIPGVDPSVNQNNIALDAVAYLDLDPGTYTMIVNSDDGFRVTAGFDARDQATSIELGKYEGGRGAEDSSFTFTITAAGAYSFRLLYYQGDGGGSVAWYAAPSTADDPHVLIGDGGIKAYRSLTGAVLPYVALANPLPGADGVGPSTLVNFAIVDGSPTKVVPATVSLSFDGVNTGATATKTGSKTTISYDPPGLLDPVSVHTVKLVYGNDATPSVIVTTEYTFKVASYINIKLPPPIILENFDEVAEGELPAGWTVQNFTDSRTEGLDLNNPNSDSYLNWVNISSNRMWFIGQGALTDAANTNDPVLGVPGQSQWDALLRFGVAEQYLNGVRVSSLITNNFMYAESDQRGGNQVQYLFSKDFDLTGKTNIYLSYNSMYEQNQDNMGSVEYSIDGGTNWLPIVIMVDVADIITGTDGKPLGYETLIAPQSDTAVYVDNDGNPAGGYYGAFLGNQDTNTWAALGPFISGRINDDGIESKRVELFRLPKADNQKTVRLRFAQAGTGSWYFGIDNVGFYSITTIDKPTFSVQPLSASRIAGLGVTFTASASGINVAYQWQFKGTAIPNATNATYTIAHVAPTDEGDYTVLATNGGGSTPSTPATLTVRTSPEPLDISPGLVAHLKFDDDYTDASGHSVTGTPQGTMNTPVFEAGFLGKAVHITNKKDGSKDAYVSLGYPDVLKFGDELTGTDYTVSFWVKQLEQNDDQAYIANKDWNSSDHPGWGIFSQSGGQARIQITGPTTAGKFSAKPPGTTLNDTTWHLLTVAVHRTGTVNSYFDGVQVSADALAVKGSIDTDDAGLAVNIGQDGTGGYTDGGSAEIDFSIDDLGIWRRALTADEAAAVYLRGLAGKALDQVPTAGSIAITAPTVGPSGITLAWTGGTGPFLVQAKLGLTDAWIDLLTTADHTATIPAAGFSGFFRVVDGTTKTVKLFHATLNGANERPTPVTTAGTGTGLLALDGLTVTYVVSYQNLTSAPIAYHLHGLGSADQAVGVLFALVPAGSLTGAGGQFAGQSTVDAATAAGIAAGQTYFNVHTTANGGGEIRGQVLP
ncbi:MAG TPA: CHRD domain-containing protein [Candidatus Limnocylindria bacterium]|nr:CHRD domain-containing protein [Candidatus Limnocylindria bacterium]